jgi:hypothetical protein
MAELRDAADQFTRDLLAQNIAGLMVAFTPEGMGKAMAMQAQAQANPRPPATGYDIELGEQEGDDHVVDIVMKSADAQATITTKWRQVAGDWKVNDISVKE